ncbi:MAG TPA: hypothetical protein PLW93_01005 [Candidatus Absconditabacterales bacterium]|nr:hypothetical protein [Candidatus Absconditabacterales bacterium]HNG96830.1 hypothetical protein [Candidatus Absconditabacterales bacterium]
MNLQGQSQTQPHMPNLPTKTTKRLGVILKQADQFLLEVNTTPGYNRITSFLNTTLGDNDGEYSEEYMQSKATEIIQQRAGYQDVNYLKTLSGSIERSFHKPDKDYNEIGLYDNSILVFELLSQQQSPIDQQYQRETLRCTNEELDQLLQANGQNGSSFLMKTLYDSQK